MDSHFSGSGAVSGVLIFSVVSALLGLVRAAYEEKNEYFASLASNILRSAQRALDVIQKTNESVSMHSAFIYMHGQIKGVLVNGI